MLTTGHWLLHISQSHTAFRFLACPIHGDRSSSFLPLPPPFSFSLPFISLFLFPFLPFSLCAGRVHFLLILMVQLWSAALFLSSISLWNEHAYAIPLRTTDNSQRRGLRRTFTNNRRTDIDVATIPARRGFDIPITRRNPTRKTKRDDVDGSVGLGDNSDL